MAEHTETTTVHNDTSKMHMAGVNRDEKLIPQPRGDESDDLNVFATALGAGVGATLMIVVTVVALLMVISLIYKRNSSSGRSLLGRFEASIQSFGFAIPYAYDSSDKLTTSKPNNASGSNTSNTAPANTSNSNNLPGLPQVREQTPQQMLDEAFDALDKLRRSPVSTQRKNQASVMSLFMHGWTRKPLENQVSDASSDADADDSSMELNNDIFSTPENGLDPYDPMVGEGGRMDSGDRDQSQHISGKEDAKGDGYLNQVQVACDTCATIYDIANTSNDDDEYDDETADVDGTGVDDDGVVEDETIVIAAPGHTENSTNNSDDDDNSDEEEEPVHSPTVPQRWKLPRNSSKEDVDVYCDHCWWDKVKDKTEASPTGSMETNPASQ